MQENARINKRQFTILVAVFTIGSSFLVAPSLLASAAKEDAWISSILGSGAALVLIWIYRTLGNRFPRMALTQYTEVILGRWLGKLVSLSFCTYFFMLSVLLLREISDFVITQIMPDTPIQFILLLFFSIVVMAVRLGLETFTRAAEIFFPWIILLFTILVVCLTPEISLQKIQPVLGEGMKPVFRALFPFLGLPFLELVVFLMIAPHVNRAHKAGPAMLTGTVLGSLILILVTVLSIMVLGADQTARNAYPSYSLAKKINIGEFLTRLESIMAGIWFLSLFFKLTISFYATAVGLAQTFRLQEYRPLIFPLALIALIFSIIAIPNLIYFRTFLERIWTPYSLTYGLGLPLLLLGVAVIRKKSEPGKENDPS